MPKRIPSTIGESLYWSYANLAMMANVLEDGAEGPGKVHFMIRSKLYAGLCKAAMQVRGFFDDEKLKITLPQACRYCGSPQKLSADHLIPQSQAGSHGNRIATSCLAPLAIDFRPCGPVAKSEYGPAKGSLAGAACWYSPHGRRRGA